jgi:hypothetical protein
LVLTLPGEPATASPAGEASGLDLGERVGCSSSPGPSFCVLTIIKPNEITKEEVKQTLSTMVLVPRSDGEPAAGEPTVDATEQTVTNNVATVLPGEMDPDVWEAAEDYYRAAGLEDWGYTCDHLDAETQSLFTRDEWLQKNQ